MRIVYVSSYALPHMGGIEVVVDHLARQMVARGHQVLHAAAASVRRDDERGGADPPYPVMRLDAWNGLEEHAGIPYPRVRPRALRTLRAAMATADVIHAHGMLFHGSAAALRAGRDTGAARVLTEHVGAVPYSSGLLNWVQGVAVRTVGRATARKAQAIVTLNSRVHELMEQLAPSARVVRIGNGVDLDRYRPPSAGERAALRADLQWDERPRALFVGRLVEKKGLSAAIAAAAIDGGAWQLVVAGPGTPPAAEAPHVEFLGALAPGRVAALYRAADLFVLPSVGEGFPLTVQEAMASGLPVVLSDDPAYVPILEGSGRGAILTSTQPDAIAAAIRELLPIARTAGEDAARFARGRFDWSRAADRHLELYEELRVQARR